MESHELHVESWNHMNCMWNHGITWTACEITCMLACMHVCMHTCMHTHTHTHNFLAKPADSFEQKKQQHCYVQNVCKHPFQIWYSLNRCGMLPKLLGFAQYREEEEGTVLLLKTAPCCSETGWNSRLKDFRLLHIISSEKLNMWLNITTSQYKTACTW